MSAQLLLVDDEPRLRQAVKDYLQASGFNVQVASNALEGWELMQRNTPDLVISDIMMPQVDGYQFLKQMREEPRFKTLPVVFLTAKGMTGDISRQAAARLRIQGYEAGVDVYIPKPFEPDELVAIIKNLLSRHAATNKSDRNLTVLAGKIDDIWRKLSDRGNGISDSKPLRFHSSTPTPLNIKLTPREQSVLDLVARGLMNKEIARDIKTSVRNVEKYVTRLFSKTGTNSRTELVRFALEHGLAK
jgi:DNA-binding NarL/FixJ family response regulator